MSVLYPLVNPEQGVLSNDFTRRYMDGASTKRRDPDTGEERGKPIRMPAYAQLNINSVDRYASATQPVSQYALFQQGASLVKANNFNISLQRPLLSGYFTRLTVSQAQLQWSVPTIVANVNDEMILFDISNNIAYEITLSPGFYNGSQLAAQIQTQVVAQAGASWSAFTCTYSTLKYGFVMASNVAGLNFRLITSSQIPGPPVPQNTSVLNLYSMIGVTYTNTSLSTSTQFLGPSRFVYTSYIDIISTKLTQYMRVKDSETAYNADTSVLCRIFTTPLNQIVRGDASGNLIGSTPFTLTWDPNMPKHIKWDPSQYVYDFDIQVKDEFGNLVPWSSGNPFEFQLTLLASET